MAILACVLRRIRYKDYKLQTALEATVLIVGVVDLVILIVTSLLIAHWTIGRPPTADWPSLLLLPIVFASAAGQLVITLHQHLRRRRKAALATDEPKYESTPGLTHPVYRVLWEFLMCLGLIGGSVYAVCRSDFINWLGGHGQNQLDKSVAKGCPTGVVWFVQTWPRQEHACPARIVKLREAVIAGYCIAVGVG